LLSPFQQQNNHSKNWKCESNIIFAAWLLSDSCLKFSPREPPKLSVCGKQATHDNVCIPFSDSNNEYVQGPRTAKVTMSGAAGREQGRRTKNTKKEQKAVKLRQTRFLTTFLSSSPSFPSKQDLLCKAFFSFYSSVTTSF